MNRLYSFHQHILDTDPWWRPLYDQSCDVFVYSNDCLFHGSMLKFSNNDLDYDWLYFYFLANFLPLVKRGRNKNFNNLKKFAFLVFQTIRNNPKQYAQHVPENVLVRLL